MNGSSYVCLLKWTVSSSDRFPKWQSSIERLLKRLSPQNILSPSDCLINWLSPRMSVSASDCFIKWLYSQVTVFAHDFLLEWMSTKVDVYKVADSTVAFSSSEILLKGLLLKLPSLQVTVSSSDCLLKWLSSQVTVSSIDCILKRLYPQVNFYLVTFSIVNLSPMTVFSSHGLLKLLYPKWLHHPITVSCKEWLLERMSQHVTVSSKDSLLGWLSKWLSPRKTVSSSDCF